MEQKILNVELNKVFRKQKIVLANLENFIYQLKNFSFKINENESEEHLKYYMRDFLKKTFYKENEINTKGNFDFTINDENKIAVIIETKAPKSKNEMLTKDNFNVKSMYQILLYFLQERIIHENNDMKNIIVTNFYEWFIFDANDFEKLFYENNELKKEFLDWNNNKKTSKKTNLFYKEIAPKYIKNINDKLKFIHFSIKNLNTNIEENQKELLFLYKVFSQEFILKKSFANDSNSLNEEFYFELLYIIGLEECKKNGKKIIQIKKDKQYASLIENTISIIKMEDLLEKVEDIDEYGETKKEQIENIALELNILWINRIIFLKLLEAQLLGYHNNDENYSFLNSEKIEDFDELNELFFEVLAKELGERSYYLKEKFKNIPHLNSSLFEISKLEKQVIRINSLKSRLKLDLFHKTVLKENFSKLPILKYIFKFLNSFDFTSSGAEEIQKEQKNLINAAVLGLIFEKINGYKEGSYFTPGYITMYMNRETIRNLVFRKLSEHYKFKNLSSFNDLKYKIEGRNKANEIINNLKICDPSVGSGHFLVSALNEIIAIKSELGILQYRNGNPIIHYKIEVENDELIITDKYTEEIFEYNLSKKGNFIDYKQELQIAIFHEKETLIENCLFGVDINANSVNICRLRLWIELLKNSYYKENSHSKKLELQTLPNIDINIKKGNSLVSRFSLNGSDMKNLNRASLQRIRKATKKYKEQVILYKSITDKRTKKNIEKNIENIKKKFLDFSNPKDGDFIYLQKLKKELLEVQGRSPALMTKEEKKIWKNDIKRLLKELNKAEKIYQKKQSEIYLKAFEWRFEFPEVLNEDGSFEGFDIIIGNPPYIEFKSINKKYKKFFKENFKTARGKYDAYIMFYELSFLLLKESGLSAFITPTRFMIRDYGKTLRKFISKNYTLIELIDFSDIQVFNKATNYTGIFILQNKKTVSKNFKYLKQNEKNNLLNPTFELINNSILKNDKWNFKGKKIDTIINKIKKGNPTLKDLVLRINSGISTGKDNVFVVNKKFVLKRNLENNYLKPFLKGKDIDRYKLSWSENYVIYPYDKNGKVIGETEFKKTSPNIFKYLLKNKKLLSGRAYFDNSNKKWYELWNQRKPSTFEKFKIVTLDNASKNSFVIDNSNFYATTTVYSFSVYDENLISNYYLLAILNSNVLNYFHRQNSIPQANGFFRYQAFLIENMPIIIANKEIQDIISKKVKKIIEYENLNVNFNNILEEINKIAYKLYGLTENEIKIIENETI